MLTKPKRETIIPTFDHRRGSCRMHGRHRRKGTGRPRRHCSRKGGDFKKRRLGAGNDHLLAHLNSGEPWDTDQAMSDYYTKLSQGLVDVRYPAPPSQPHQGHRPQLESYGIEMRDPATGQYIRTQSFGQPGPYFINFKGKNIKPVLANEVKKRGVKVFNRINVACLVIKREAGRRCGRVKCLEIGNFCIVRAKTTLWAKGHPVASGLILQGFPFNTWKSPYNNGAGHAPSFRGRGNPCQHGTDRQHACPQGISARQG